MRCAVHPSRPAFDNCPVCDRPRCAFDAQMGAKGCASCTARKATREPKLAAGTAALAAGTAGVVAAVMVTIIGGGIESEYVGARFFSILMPGLVGMAVGGCAIAVAKFASLRERLPESMRTALRGFSILISVISADVGFKFADTPLSHPGRWVPPFVAAAVGAFVWTVPSNETGYRRKAKRKA